MKQFEIWWATLPEPVGRRPILLLGRSSALPYLGRTLAAEVTTTVRAIPQEVELGRREGLSRRCVANLDQARSIPVSTLTKKIGQLSATRHEEVKRALGHVLHWPELTSL